jgi:hypothetical protein
MIVGSQTIANACVARQDVSRTCILFPVESQYDCDVNPNNPVVKLCVEGMKAEFEGRASDALACFTQAWELRKDDFDGCIAAHYVARHQRTPEEMRYWNLESLKLADAVNDERVQEFYPSLYLNLGKSEEDLGNREAAKRYYELARTKCSALALAEGRYTDVLRDGIARALDRVS